MLIVVAKIVCGAALGGAITFMAKRQGRAASAFFVMALASFGLMVPYFPSQPDAGAASDQFASVSDQYVSLHGPEEALVYVFPGGEVEWEWEVSVRSKLRPVQINEAAIGAWEHGGPWRDDGEVLALEARPSVGDIRRIEAGRTRQFSLCPPQLDPRTCPVETSSLNGCWTSLDRSLPAAVRLRLSYATEDPFTREIWSSWFPVRIVNASPRG